MSLFGASPDGRAAATTTKSRLSLFDDEDVNPTPGSKSSLFADDDTVPGSSPWGIPVTKKADRGELIKTLLPASDVPDSYIDTFDNVFNGGDSIGGKISSAGMVKILTAGNLGADDQSRITSIIFPNGQPKDLDRNEFNVLLALIGLAQEHEDVSLDSVDERRRSKSSLFMLDFGYQSKLFFSNNCNHLSSFGSFLKGSPLVRPPHPVKHSRYELSIGLLVEMKLTSG